MLETLLAMDIWVIASFVGAGIILNLTPGADVVFATACGIKGGWQQGVAAAIGITLGGMVHVLFAVAGLSAAIAAIPNALDVVRYLGAAYLAYLAVQAWRTKAVDQGHSAGVTHVSSAIRKGAITNVLNPKVGLFVLAFLTQFTSPAIGPVWQQMLILGGLFTFTGLIINGLYGAISGIARSALQSHLTILNKISAVIFGGLAARLVLD